MKSVVSRVARLFAVLLIATGVLPGCGPPPMLVDWVSKGHPEALFKVECSDSLVALTIDDGPTADWTPDILEVLERNDAKATFFLMGARVAGNEDLVQHIVDAGHEIGNHMMSPTPSIFLSAEVFESRMHKADSILAAFGPVRWFRPASGWFNGRMHSQITGRGYGLALGSVYPNDAMNPITPYLTHYVSAYTRPGSIIVLHDGLGWRTRAPTVLDRVLPELRERGYRFVTLSTLVDECRRGV